nr:MAG TPA: hypothetical protein [Crassvirales sp.]
MNLLSLKVSTFIYNLKEHSDSLPCIYPHQPLEP